ncbi:hypothetical protein BGZ83_003635 [Gryganskiella cystojenkinii]|nr:hypothetical protein BGZ83_003635 [Gryganskiella cystojenkinii]
MWDPNMDTLRLGVLLNLHADPKERESEIVRKALSVIRMAVNDVNEQQIIPGLNMSIIVRDSQDPRLYSASGGSAAISGAGHLISAKVSGVVGDVRSDLTRYEALMTSSVQIPQCSFASGREYVSARASKLGIFILAYLPLSTAGAPIDPTFKYVRDRIDSSQSRVHILVATGKRQHEFLEQMRRYGLFSPEYAWITMNDLSSLLRQEPNVKDYDGLIMVDNGWELNGYEPYETFLEKWLTLNPDEYPGSGNPMVNSNEALAYSCVMMMADAYADLITRTIPDPALIPHSSLIQEIKLGDRTEDSHVIENYQNKPYRGPAGPITLDYNGDRKEGYYVAMSLHDGKPVQFGIMFSGNYTSIRKPIFKDSHPDVPGDAPPWAIKNPRWKSASGIVCGIICCMGILLTLVAAALVIYFKDHIIIKASRQVVSSSPHDISIPNRAVCIAQTFILPVGVTLLAGSLTVKNYRIYRIFNSVTVSNQGFQTQLLLRYLALGVLLCLIPMIVEVILDAPHPHATNIRAFQWVRCRGHRAQIWWIVSEAVIPTILILFGVFLAFKTRNVVFLWNEAKQIAIVLYNSFFFATIIFASQAFPLDLYLATFYISIVGTIFIAWLSLIVLFLPKFLGIWKSSHKPWGDGGHPSQRNQGGLVDGGGGGNFGGAAAMGRLPGDIKVSRRSAGTTALIAATTAAATDVVLADGHRQSITTAEKGLEKAFSSAKRSSSSGSTNTSSAAIPKIEGNPLGAWMNSRMTQKGSVSTAGSGTFSTESLDDGASFALGRRKEGGSSVRQILQSNVDLESQKQTTGRLGNETSGVGGPAGESDPQEPLHNDLRMDRTFGSSSTGAHRMLDAYLFLLPIRVHKRLIASLLSHWSMATLILIPEAHAFLSVDSTDGKSTSYLMLSMYQLEREVEPTLRVMTCHAGTLLIRFSSQHRLDFWMSLFSEEDLQALSAKKPYTSSTNSNPPFASGYSSAGGLEGDGGGATMRRRSANMDRMPDFTNQPITNTQSSGISPGILSDLGLGGPPYADTSIEPPQPSPWTTRLSFSNNGLSRLQNTKVTSKSDTSGTSGQSAYDTNNTFNLNYSQHPQVSPQGQNQFSTSYLGSPHPHSTGEGDGFEGDHVPGPARRTRAGGEWTSTDNANANYIPTRRQSTTQRQDGSSNYVHRKSLKNQAPFIPMTAGETVVEDEEGEREAPSAVEEQSVLDTSNRAEPAAEADATISSVYEATHPVAPIADEVATNPETEAHVGQDQPLPAGQSRESAVDSYVLATPSAVLPSAPTKVAPSARKPATADSFISENEQPRDSLSTDRSLIASVPIEDDDDDDDDLYDPEFGIGGGQRRRRRRTKPSRLSANLGVGGNASIPPAHVISAAAAAISAGWSEKDALAAAMANSPALSQMSLSSNVSSAATSSSGSRTRHESQTSMSGNSYFTLGSRSRKKSVGEGYFSSSNASSMFSNQGDPSGSSGNGGHMATRIFGDRVNMSPANGSNGKRMSASAGSMLTSRAPLTPQSLSATAPSTPSPAAPPSGESARRPLNPDAS